MALAAQPNDTRLPWLDGLRGVAAGQVVLLHYAAAFLPGLGTLDLTLLHYPWERIVVDTPLYAVLNGYMAVYLFFLLSGAALTYSFARRPFAFVQSVLRRILRLGIPMAAALLLGALLLWWLPGAHRAAAELTGSRNWLGAVSPSAVSVGMILHQMLLEGMVAGYGDLSLLPSPIVARLGLDTLAHALDAPLWTLHIEFIGSLLVILLVMIRAAAPPWLHRGICVVLGGGFITSPLVLFVAGHLTAPMLLRRRSGRAFAVAGLILLLAGVALSSGRVIHRLDHALAYLPAPPFGVGNDVTHSRYTIAALFVFYGVTLLPAAQAMLSRPIARWLGKLSFSLYLTHFPILFTMTSALFLHALPRLGYGAAAAACTVLGIGFTLMVAILFQRWVDRPAIRLSRGEISKVGLSLALPFHRRKRAVGTFGKSRPNPPPSSKRAGRSPLDPVIPTRLEVDT